MTRTHSLRACSLLTFLSTLVCSFAAGQSRVIPQWVFPAKGLHLDELSPSERTRPLVVGDILYFASTRGEVIALHRIANYVLWRKKLPAGIDGALAYGRSLIFAGDSQGNLFALNARDGSEAWKFKVQAEWLSPPVVARDKVYAVTSSDELYALSANQGKELWHFSHRGDEKMTIRGTASPVVYGTEIFQGFSDGYMVALSTHQGRVLWTKKLRMRARFYDIDFTPYVDEQNVVVASMDGSLYNLDRTTGNTRWIYPVGSYSGAYVEGDRVYFPGLNGTFYALSLSAGTVAWKTEIASGVGAAPTRAGDYLVVTTSSDPVYLIDPKDGTIVWKGGLGSGTFAGAAAGGDGWFYCLSNYGNLYSFQIGSKLDVPKGPRVTPPRSATHPLG